jgi:hypothetical protein
LPAITALFAGKRFTPCHSGQAIGSYEALADKGIVLQDRFSQSLPWYHFGAPIRLNRTVE